MDYFDHYKKCDLCPRGCGIDRFRKGKNTPSGFCMEGADLRVAYIGPHFGEEPPITGEHGSGTVFFTGCSLRCSYCQNHQISSGGMGQLTTLKAVLKRIEKMITVDRVQNVNFVTPDHFFPHVFQLVTLLRKKGYTLPMVFNLSGYQSKDMLRTAQDFVDIYLPDFKYADSSLAVKLSRCPNYPETALEAISEMVRQKGFLNAIETGAPLAGRGVLVRHLILPGKVENSRNALTSLFLEFGPHLPLSLMSQYTPALPQTDDDLNRSITRNEFERVYRHALDLGFEQLFVQFPALEGTNEKKPSPFMPDFHLTHPFSGTREA